MQNRNAQGFVNPFGQANGNRNFGRQSQGYQQPQQGFGFQEEPEQDPRFETQAYLKIKFHTADGVKTLKQNGKDITLRDASELESMILDVWRSGGDVNELLNCMELEVVDATPKERGTNSFITRNAAPAPAPAPKKAQRGRSKPAPQEEDEE